MWRDISTAPKDGTWFVALENGETYPCEWRADEPDEGPYHEGWWDHFNSSFENPTQWTPVPNPEDASLSGSQGSGAYTSTDGLVRDEPKSNPEANRDALVGALKQIAGLRDKPILRLHIGDTAIAIAMAALTRVEAR